MVSPQPLVSRPYKLFIPVSVTATVTEHLIAGRLTLDQYLALGRELGFTAKLSRCIRSMASGSITLTCHSVVLQRLGGF